MSGAKVSLYIASAFAVGALFPLLGLLAGAFVIGSVWATSRAQPHNRECDPALLAEIEEWTKAEQKRLR